jgi:hypothetical protein
VCHERSNRYIIEIGTPLIANGSEISRIGGGVTITKKKTNEKYRRLGNISIFLQDLLK